MKKRFFAFLAALTLLAALTAQAGAIRTTTAPGESWRTERERYGARFAATYAEAHPQEYAAFREEDYAAFLEELGEYMDDFGLDGEAFRKLVWLASLEDEELQKEAMAAYYTYIVEAYEAEFPGDIDRVGIPWILMVYGYESMEGFMAERSESVEEARLVLAGSYVQNRQMAAENHDMTLEYRVEYPGSYEWYDPDKGYEGYWAYLKDNMIARYGLQNEEEFKEYMYVRGGVESWLREQEEAAKRTEYPLRWPEEYTAFDPYAWFAGYYGGPLSMTPESYMEQESLDAEGFKRDMFMQWADKEPTSFFNGYCVTVNGTPIQFQFYRDLDGEVVSPRVENERILIPLRAAAEALGLAVEWKGETNQVICADENAAVTFTLDSAQYSGGALDVAPYAENGVTYLPLRALGEALGCGVSWNQDFATAALTTGTTPVR